ncbi:MAG: SDR family oxidoreductase [Gemmatimonadales bacterium]
MHHVFLTGGTGYLGARIAERLVARGHEVRALARPGSEGRLPPGCRVVPGDALDYRTYAAQVAPCDTLVHLVGVSHPGPAKAALFRTVDVASVREALAAAGLGVRHFVYVSVAQPAPIMTAYWTARAEAEELIRANGLDATILRPWYVLGPGHWWPVVLIPLYGLASLVPSTRDSARRLGLVRVGQMIRALVETVEHPPTGTRALEVADIRNY